MTIFGHASPEARDLVISHHTGVFEQNAFAPFGERWTVAAEATGHAAVSNTAQLTLDLSDHPQLFDPEG